MCMLVRSDALLGSCIIPESTVKEACSNILTFGSIGRNFDRAVGLEHLN